MLTHRRSQSRDSGEQAYNRQHAAHSLEWELTPMGVMLKCAGACERCLGYSQEEIMALFKKDAFLSLIHSDDRKQFLQLLQESKVAQELYVLRFKTKTGDWRHIAYNAKINPQTHNRYVSGLDISNLLKDPTFLFNEGRNFIQQLLGVTEFCQTKFEEKNCMEWIMMGEMVLKNLTALLQSPVHESTSSSKKKNTRPKSVDTDFDEKESKISLRKDIPTEIKGLAEETKNLYKNSVNFHAIIDINARQVYTLNEHTTHVFGYTETMLNKMMAAMPLGYISLLHENDRESAINNLNAVRSGIPCFGVARIKRFESASGYVNLGYYAIPNTALGIFHLVSKDLAPYLIDMRKLFHEARNGLQLIQDAFTETREILIDTHKEIQVKRKEVASLAEQAKICIWNLLRIFQRQTVAEFLDIRPIAMDLTACIDRVAGLFKVEATKKGLVLHESLPQEALYVLDRLQFEGILLNLLTNALKYTQRGRISVTLSITPGQNNNAGDGLRITVTDTGIGISDEGLSHLFEPYYRTTEAKATSSGVGIGLPLVKQIVEKMGGNINIESKLHQGTTCTLVFTAKKATAIMVKEQQLLEKLCLEQGKFLPLNLPQATPRSATRCFVANSEGEKISPRTELKDLKILLVDDSLINTKIFEKMLTKLGCICSTVNSGKLAIQELTANNAKNGNAFDIIFMDVVMPELDGLETTMIIKDTKLAEESIIIGLSGNAEPEAEQKALQAGMVDYLIKPVTEKKLEMVLKKNLPKLYMTQPKRRLSTSHIPKSPSLNLSSLGLFSATQISSASSSTVATIIAPTETLQDVSMLPSAYNLESLPNTAPFAITSSSTTATGTSIFAVDNSARASASSQTAATRMVLTTPAATVAAYMESKEAKKPGLI